MATTGTAGSRVENVVEQLREWIFHGKYPPGTPIRELVLARELSVSQATVREALQRLEHTGLVTRTSNIGSTVTRLSPKDIRERIELRALLEVAAAQQASARMDDGHYKELQRRLDAMDAAVAANDYYDSAQADLEFHRYIWRCSGNETLSRHLELVVVPLFTFVSIVRSQGLQELTDLAQGHQPLIDALKSRDAAVISDAFGTAAVTPYLVFLGEGRERTALMAFGLMAT